MRAHDHDAVFSLRGFFYYLLRWATGADTGTGLQPSSFGIFNKSLKVLINIGF